MMSDSVHGPWPQRDVLTAAVGRLEAYLQPVIDVATGAVWGYEALARFRGGPLPEADAAIDAAHRAGYGSEVEAACLAAALARRRELPAGARLALNVTPSGLLSEHVREVWDDDLHGVVVEVTEHHAMEADRALAEFDRLRARGAAIAVDDVGSGYAGLLRLATMHPDVVKLDRTIVSGARTSEAQRAVVETLVAFSHRIHAEVVGEGVESLDDLAALIQLDVDYGQGWAIGRPAAQVEAIPADVVSACQRERAELLRRHGSLTAVPSSTQAMHELTGALSRATELAALHVAVAQAAAELGVDVIAVSVLGVDGVLRAITAGGDVIDTHTYAVSHYPATRKVIESGIPVEAHVDDLDSDPAERELLKDAGKASLLMVPLTVGDHRVGVLEFMQRTHRRWSSMEIANARGLSMHLGNALRRITG